MLISGGKDATREFHDIHNKDATDAKEMFCIGTVIEEPKKKPVDAILNPK